MPRFNGYIDIAAKDSVSSYESNRLPAHRPNVVYIVLDDTGFGHLGCYGSPIHTPNLDRLASNGIRYNNFHTTAVCSATRASLLTGTNHHAVGMATIAGFDDNGFPNQQNQIDPHYATTAELLRKLGYATFCVGKWHLCPFENCRDAGPFDNWPLQRGFDRYYGFLESQTDEFYPDLVRDNERIRTPKTPEEGYHLTTDLADQAITLLFRHHASRPGDPFFLYFAPGACHAPHQAPREYIERYRGAFDEGWDVYRERTLERQKELGVVPPDTRLTERNEMVRAWDTLSDDEKTVYARYMEVFAGYLEHADAQIGRVLDYLDEIGATEDTLIVFLSDNGATAEGGPSGKINQEEAFGWRVDSGNVADSLPHLDEIGGPGMNGFYPSGWANAGNTPFAWFKYFSDGGGVNDPLIVSYPKEIGDGGAIRRQYVHVSDITPTVLDILGVDKPVTVNDVPQRPFTGISIRYTFSKSGAEEPSRRRTQYYEQRGSRAIYNDGWRAVAHHLYDSDYFDDTWELFHVAEDFSESQDVSAEYPRELERLKALWFAEAGRNNVLPLPAGMLPAEKPEVIAAHKDATGRETNWVMQKMLIPAQGQTFSYRGIIRPLELPRSLNVFSRSHVIKVGFEYRAGDNGVIVTAGNAFGGYALLVADGRALYGYNANKRAYAKAESRPLPEGFVRLQLDFRVDADNSAATVKLAVNGELQATARINRFANMSMAASHPTLKDGLNTPVFNGYRLPFEYPRTIDEFSFSVAPFEFKTEEDLAGFFDFD